MPSAIPFATEAWIKRLADECNNNPAYHNAAKNLEGDIYFVVEAEGRLEKNVYMYMYLCHGQCREAFVPEDHTSLNPELWVSGSVSAWKEVAEKNIDPLKALLTRKLSVRGSMTKVVRHSKVAHALMKCSENFETDFSL
jgi:putative sterol carrier protein